MTPLIRCWGWTDLRLPLAWLPPSLGSQVRDETLSSAGSPSVQSLATPEELHRVHKG